MQTIWLGRLSHSLGGKTSAVRFDDGLAVGNAAADDTDRTFDGIEQFRRHDIDAGAAIMHHHAVVHCMAIEVDIGLRQVRQQLHGRTAGLRHLGKIAAAHRGNRGHVEADRPRLSRMRS